MMDTLKLAKEVEKIVIERNGEGDYFTEIVFWLDEHDYEGKDTELLASEFELERL